MLKRFLRWSWLAPVAKRLLRTYGKLVLQELLKRVNLPRDIEDKIGALPDDLSAKDVELIRACAEFMSLSKSEEGKKVAKVLNRIASLLS